MTDPFSPASRRDRKRRYVALGPAVVILIAALCVTLPSTVRADTATVASAEFVNVSATSSLSFAPDSFTVLPGASVHLVVTQLANFNHTFTLSPAANVTIPTSDSPGQVTAFFQAHPPIVNLSLGSVVGGRFFANFSAPTTLGTYEFICLIHFPAMFGSMTVASSLPGGSTGTSPSSLEILGIGVGLGIVLIGAVLVLFNRARHRSQPNRPAPPASPP